MECLGHNSTLLGVDLFTSGELQAADVKERDILEALSTHQGPVRVMITAIGGQGHNSWAG